MCHEGMKNAFENNEDIVLIRYVLAKKQVSASINFLYVRAYYGKSTY